MALKENIELEFKEFKNDIISLSKEEIFEEAFKINFYTEVSNYILALPAEHELMKFNFKLNELLEFYIKYDGLNIGSGEGIENLLITYTQRFKFDLNKMMAEYYACITK